MEKTTRMRVRRQGLLNEVQVLVRHPMKAAGAEAADCIEKLTCRCNGAAVGEIYTGANVAENPLFVLAVDEICAGDLLEVCWRDSRGDRGQAALLVS
ncbi:thiosulfate oxidation carrier complex protein SoxZ [Pelagibius marinus]|uniref:thiosulfate oxidation carrier complex protein SoxZ n=1 Tax=Pelagibius marinus TaxID=2762760 RepID=UPI0018722142|nr:thiosulfate oxidation carrier complex protein SoxZ [Pelagibius marinus]